MKFGTQRDLTAVAAAPAPQAESDVDFALEETPGAGSEPAAEAEQPLNIDWISVGLGLLALIAVGGLIPFWMWIYFVYHPPIK
jgi:hypothetical protein